MAKNFRQLEAKMGPERAGRARAAAKVAIAELLLAEIRQAEGLTQEQLAEILGVKQPTLSRMESQDDMQIGTLQRLVEALGGKLEIIAHMPKGAVRIRQFEGVA